MKFSTKKDPNSIGILGAGNLLLSDQGFGVHFIQHLEKSYHIADNVKVRDAETLGCHTAPFIEDNQFIFVIDTIELDTVPGSIYHFSIDDVRSGKIPLQIIPHQVGFIALLEVCTLRGYGPARVEFITIVPKIRKTGVDLSVCLNNKFNEVTDILKKKIAFLPNGAGINALQIKKELDSTY